jgi:hypothetical protein
MPKSPATPAYQPGVIYEVAVARPFTFNGHKHLPRHEHRIEGATLAAIIEQEGADVVRSAKPVE